ncbi:cytochrome b/b6 domain-containing protein [Agromyces sp. ZXT2-3]|uniref:cytochrome b/b6 domain-containing protein n=1 Tax=Agromyces sp. ZXT2-3 TaxID=3461152 RepID=UPI004054DAEE
MTHETASLEETTVAAAPSPVARTEPAAEPVTVTTPAPATATPPQPAPAAPATAAGTGLRRGLPRVAGGDPWPPEAVAPVARPTAPVVASASQAETERTAPAAAASASPAETERMAPAAASTSSAEPIAPTPAMPRPIAPPPGVAEAAEPDAPTRPAARAEAAARTAPAAPTAPTAPTAPAPEPSSGSQSGPERLGRLTARQWVGASVVGVLAIIGAATIVVQLTRWFLGLDVMEDFLETYPGETPLPDGAPVGFPAWLGWQHFFNVFLIVLIIRSGLQVRTERRPPAYWTPRWSPNRKISLTLWFHQSLDILWLVNGLVFVVLLFATGQWMRVVPTSWEVIPNSISALLQYLSLDWPLEDGWVNYNSLQVLAYFTTIFIAAPLAAITGVRMSGLWPKDATTLNRIYPVEWARAVHFPVMLYFVAFIVVHVTLVFLTGALRNLNHMYAAQDDGGWLGFWIFVASIVVIAAAWIAARPTVLAPIAGLFGRVGR